MSFQTISNFPALATESNEYHSYIFNNEKIWVFSKKYVEQPTYKWGHRVVFAGGYSTYFDTKSSEWDPKGKVDFKQQSTEENLEELLFTFQNQIFLMLYSHFGGVQFLSLLRFDENARDFQRFAQVESDQKSQRVSTYGADTKHHAIIADGETPDSKYLISYVDQIIQVHRLTISADGQARVAYVGEITNELVNAPPIHPTSAVVINGAVYIQGAVQGCGMMWDRKRVYKVDVNSGEVKVLEASGDDPHFSFTGSRYTALNPRTKAWTHFTGNTRVGMTGSEFNGEIWSLTNLTTDNPQWEKLGLEAPDPDSQDPLVVTDSDVTHLYVGSTKIGVAKAKLD